MKYLKLFEEHSKYVDLFCVILNGREDLFEVMSILEKYDYTFSEGGSTFYRLKRVINIDDKTVLYISYYNGVFKTETGTMWWFKSNEEDKNNLIQINEIDEFMKTFKEGQGMGFFDLKT